MADVLKALGKTKKVTLPPGWVERFSKKHPDKPFYFNENTGESRWSAPLDLLSDKNAEKSGRKGKKRKNRESETEESGDETLNASTRLLKAITANRPKLKAKGLKTVTPNETKESADTPAMRLYREKMAQRKAALEAKAKKTTPKVASQKQNQTVIPQKKVPQVSMPTASTSFTPRRSRRTSSALSSNESISSDCTTISNASSMGTKIKEAAAPIAKSSNKTNKSLEQSVQSKLPKIPRVQLVKTNVSTNKSNTADCETLSDTSETNKSFRNESNRRFTTPPCTKKNAAQERLDNLRKSLSSERDKNCSPKRSRLSLSANNNNIRTSPLDKSRLFNSPTPNLLKTAQQRLFSLDNRVQNSCMLEINKKKHLTGDEEEDVRSKRVLEKVETAGVYYEEMDWEPIADDKIMSEVYSVRSQLCENPAEKLSELSCNALQSVSTNDTTNALYVIVDTNVFLSNLPFIEEVRNSNSDIFGRPFIVVPWTVLQELDYIKDDKNHTRSQALKLKARKAVDFLNKHFAAKHPRFLGQTPMDVEANKKKFEIDCPDDEILQTCLQIKESSKSPILLSYDKNLCNKAMIHDIPILGRNDPLEKIYYLKAAETTQFLSNSLHSHIEEKQQDVSSLQKELLEADDIMEEGKAILKAVLSEVVSKEMENLFGNRWQMHVIIRPPWSINTVLKCALKHWMAAVSESFIRKTEPMLRDIQEFINNPPASGRKLENVKFFLEKCNDIVQTLDANKYPSLKSQSLTKIDELRQRCLNTIVECKTTKFKESVGTVEDAYEEEARASLAFKVLEDIYAFARDACGIAADTLGLQCSFTFNKLHPFITSKMALQQQQDIGVNVNRLLQVLRMTLSKIEEDITPNDKVIFALYEALVNFSSDLNFEELVKMSPLDLYCCIKLKKSKLEKGYEQLQELAVHFCRMANYQCT